MEHSDHIKVTDIDLPCNSLGHSSFHLKILNLNISFIMVNEFLEKALSIKLNNLRPQCIFIIFLEFQLYFNKPLHTYDQF